MEGKNTDNEIMSIDNSIEKLENERKYLLYTKYAGAFDVFKIENKIKELKKRRNDICS